MVVLFGPEVFVQRRGGISRYHVELHKGLLEQGHRSVILAGWHHNETLRGVPRVLGVRAKRDRFRTTVNERLLRAASAVNRSAIVHKTYYSLPDPAWLSRRLAITVHDLIYELHPEHFPTADDTAARQRWWAEHANAVLVPSETTARDLCDRYGVDDERVTVTPLGVRPPASVSYAAVPSRPYVMYVGLRASYKWWRGAVAALKQLGPDRPLLVCVGGGPFDADEMRLLSDTGLMADVVQVDAPDDETLFGLYRRCLALVHTSIYEGFGLPILEAMTQECPVVASSGGAVPEVTENAALLVEPRSVEALVDGLTTILTDSERRAQLVRRGLERSALFTWTRTVRLTVDAYERLIL